MISVAAARKIILSMPESEELRHQGHPDFRVNNKIFATLWPAEARAVLKVPIDADSEWLKSSPKALSVIAWGKQRWTNVHLNHISGQLFRELVKDAWYRVAPKKLTAKHIALD